MIDSLFLGIVVLAASTLGARVAAVLIIEVVDLAGWCWF